VEQHKVTYFRIAIIFFLRSIAHDCIILVCFINLELLFIQLSLSLPIIFLLSYTTFSQFYFKLFFIQSLILTSFLLLQKSNVNYCAKSYHSLNIIYIKVGALGVATALHRVMRYHATSCLFGEL